MPKIKSKTKSKTAKKTPTKKTGVQKLLSLVNPDSPKKKFILFIAVFVAIGASFMAYRSFAATSNVVGVYWPQQLRQAAGSPWQQYSSAGAKKDTVVWMLNKFDAIRIQDEWRPLIWAKHVRVCANVYNRERANPVNVDIYPTFNGNEKTGTIRSVLGNGTYQQICSDYVLHDDPNARIGGVIIHNPSIGNGAQIQVSSMSIDYLAGY